MKVPELFGPGAAANLILAGLALGLIAIGAFGWWLAAHPAKVQLFLYSFRHHPRVVRAEKRYRSQIQFLVQRFHPEGAFGLSFTVGLATLVISVWMFKGLLQDVLAQEELALFDAPIVGYIAAHRLNWLAAVMVGISATGSEPFLILLSVICGLLLRYRTGSWRPLLLLAAAMFGALLLESLGKLVIARPRPPVEWMALHASGFGFPSGHSTEATAVYGALAYVTAQAQTDWRKKIISLTIGTLIAFLIGASRVYLGVHWPTDVMAGWALGVAWLSVVFTTSSTIENTRASSASSKGIEQVGGSRSEEDTELSALERKRPRVALEGLSDEQVRVRLERGEINRQTERASRSIGEILRANLLTRFNALLGSLFVIMLWVGPPQDALFGIILVVNTLVGIVQELRAKFTLDRLVILGAQTAHVIRDGISRELRIGQIVLDDLLELRPGDQVPVDGVVVVADGLEVDESLLTGESEPVTKQVDEEILSGSLVIAGSARVQAMRVGRDSYAHALAAETRRFALARSEIREGTDRILAYVTWLLVPTAALLLVTQLLESSAGWRDAVASSVGAVVGMVPEGLILLTTVALAAAVVRLGRRKVLVQELSAVELLARADIVCFDKTGTLTDGRISFEKLILAPGLPGSIAANLCSAIVALAHLESNPNATIRAVAEAIHAPDGEWKIKAAVPFSSARKWAAASFEDHGTWTLGAPEILLGSGDGGGPLASQAEDLASSGRRVLALTHSAEPFVTSHEPPLSSDSIPVALLIFSETLRTDAVATIRYLCDQGVRLKIISGDNPRTVGAIAEAAGVPGAERPLSGVELSDDPDAFAHTTENTTAFGRVSPHQKREMIAELKRRGHTVAMLGDGINDALALKEADIGIAMGSGTSASRAVAQAVLLGDSFEALPRMVAEGRRVVANVERTANLFLAKTAYVLPMALAVGEAGVEYPFLPRHLTLIGSLTIGIPAFFLALAPNTTRARPGFVFRVLRFSVPAGFIAAGATLVAYAATRVLYPRDLDMARTAATLTLAAAGWSILVFLGRANALWQRLLLGLMAVGLSAVVILAPLREFFALQIPGPFAWAAIGAMAIATHLALDRLSRRSDKPRAGKSAA